MPALALQEVAELQQSRRAGDTAAVTRTGTGPESGPCGRHRGRRAQAGPAARALCPASLPRRQSPSPSSSSLPQAPAPLPAPCQPGGDRPALLCNLPAEHPQSERHPGAGPDPRLRFLPRATSCHGPITPCQSLTPSGFSPAPHGAALAYPHSLPAPSSSLHRLPPAASVPTSPRLVGSTPAGLPPSRPPLPWHGCHMPAARAGEEHHPGHAGACQRGRGGSGFPRDAGAFPRQHRGPRPGTERRAAAPVHTVNSRYYSNNFPCMIDFSARFCTRQPPVRQVY